MKNSAIKLLIDDYQKRKREGRLTAEEKASSARIAAVVAKKRGAVSAKVPVQERAQVSPATNLAPSVRAIASAPSKALMKPAAPKAAASAGPGELLAAIDAYAKDVPQTPKAASAAIEDLCTIHGRIDPRAAGTWPRGFNSLYHYCRASFTIAKQHASATQAFGCLRGIIYTRAKMVG